MSLIKTARRVAVWALMRATRRLCLPEDRALAPTIIRTPGEVHITGGVMGALHEGLIGGDHNEPYLVVSNNLFWEYPDPRLIAQNPITPRLDGLIGRWVHRKDGNQCGTP